MCVLLRLEADQRSLQITSRWQNTHLQQRGKDPEPVRRGLRLRGSVAE